jgi:hypothetical protein
MFDSDKARNDHGIAPSKLQHDLAWININGLSRWPLEVVGGHAGGRITVEEEMSDFLTQLL